MPTPRGTGPVVSGNGGAGGCRREVREGRSAAQSGSGPFPFWFADFYVLDGGETKMVAKEVCAVVECFDSGGDARLVLGGGEVWHIRVGIGAHAEDVCGEVLEWEEGETDETF